MTRLILAEGARGRLVGFPLREAQCTALSQQAQAAELSAQECTRLNACTAAAAKLLGAPGTISAAAPRPDAFVFRIRQDLKRVRLNLNHIARSLDKTGEHEPEELRTAARDLDGILRRMLAAIASTKTSVMVPSVPTVHRRPASSVGNSEPLDGFYN